MNPHIDLGFLKKMMAGDEVLVAKFLSIFKNQCPQQLQALKRHLQDQDWECLSNVVHGMKAQFTYLSSHSLAEKARVIEQMVDDGQTAQLGVCIKSLEEELNHLLLSLS